ncbi:ATP-binding cassette domain-containing protein, partial [Actinomadura roseirufa]|uniref:ATP-binding cassette domain-containing protein n=1 Tax=Actinomadura roseirufa TaxID=2094049 RepID=UPI001040E1EF
MLSVHDVPAPRQALPALRVSGVSKSYGGVKALRDLSLEALPGEIHAVLGENGAGKSTLVRILAGVVRPDGGEVTLGDGPLVLRGPRDAAAAGIRVAFQELSLLPDLSVAANLRLGASPGRRSARTGDAKAALEDAGVHGVRAASAIRDLSLADRQRVELVKALAARPAVLVLDEANSALSGDRNDWFLEHARRVAARGGVVLLVTHRLAEVRRVADRVTVLRGGRVVLRTTPGQVTDDELVTAMAGRRHRRGARRRDRPATGGPL